MQVCLFCSLWHNTALESMTQLHCMRPQTQAQPECFCLPGAHTVHSMAVYKPTTQQQLSVRQDYPVRNTWTSASQWPSLAALGHGPAGRVPNPAVEKLSCAFALSRFPCPPHSQFSHWFQDLQEGVFLLIIDHADVWSPLQPEDHPYPLLSQLLSWQSPVPHPHTHSPPTGVSCFPPLLTAISALSPCWFNSQLHLFIWRSWTSTSICFQTHPSLNTFHCVCAHSVLTFVTGMITMLNNLNLVLT